MCNTNNKPLFTANKAPTPAPPTREDTARIASTQAAAGKDTGAGPFPARTQAAADKATGAEKKEEGKEAEKPVQYREPSP